VRGHVRAAIDSELVRERARVCEAMQG